MINYRENTIIMNTKQLIIGITALAILSISFTFSLDKGMIKHIEKSFQFIPSGLANVNGDTMSVQFFYMLDHEVTNKEYRQFLLAMEKENPKLLEKLKVKEEGWSQRFQNGYVKPMDDHYFLHEAYDSYPVVNISQYAARAYCDWLGRQINQGKSEQEQVIVRLPTRAEFIRAGAGNNLEAQYSWGNNYMQNAQGDWLCNFTRIPQARMSRSADGLVVKESNVELKGTKKEAMFTAKTKSYFPSSFAIYNLNGNVAEWLSDEGVAAGGSWYDYGYDVRLQSLKESAESSPEIGFRPVYTVVK